MIDLDHMSPFEISLSNDETIIGRVFTTNEILLWTGDNRRALRNELEDLILKTFPKLSEEYREELVSGYFERPGNSFQRYVFLLRNSQTKLMASTMFDFGSFEYDARLFKGIYSVLRIVSPEYEGCGIAQQMAVQEFVRFKPDILFSTSYQSAALHSWIGLYEKRLITGYEVFPRLEQNNGQKNLITIPLKDLDFAVNVFILTYRGFAQREETIKKAIRNLTILLVRKNAHAEAYEHLPWEKGGRKDELASELGLSDQDAVLVMFRKTT